MPSNVDGLQQRFARLSSREKIMVVATVVLTLWWAWDSWFYQPLSRQQHAVANDISQLQTQLQMQQQLADRLQASIQSGGNNPARQQLSQLQQGVTQLKQQLSLGGKKFVPAPMMAAALRDLLQQQGNLKLLKLETLPVSGFGNQEDEPIWVYRHAMLITVQGDYFSTLNYLKALEALPWRIHWDSITYRVTDYPLAETKIQVYTLSFEEAFLGV